MTTYAKSFPTSEPSRSKRLKAATAPTHERLDHTILRQNPFASRARYAAFLAVQHLFHRDIDWLYDAAELQGLLADLPRRKRLFLIARDLADLGAAEPLTADHPLFGRDAPFDRAEALGWLYVAEGSNLGAAFLLKAASNLGLSTDFGARHLAASPDGRGLAWRSFTAALDAFPLSPDEEEHVVDGATAAFARVHSLVRAAFSEHPTPDVPTGS